MQYHFGKTVIIGLGGSIVYPKTINVPFLKKFEVFIRKWIKQKQFLIVIGGGRLSRIYQKAASLITSVSNEDKDWIGIHATRLNAQLLRTIFRDIADPVIFDHRHKTKKLRYPVTIGSGWRPGWSTDYVSLALASDLKIPEAIIAGKPAYVYDKDNAIYKNAKSFTALSWQEYRALIPEKWVPGAHAPVDPVGARLAEQQNLKAIIINGKNLKNFDRLLAGKDFQGTVIN